MNGSGPPQWRSTLWHSALTILGTAIAVYIAAQLVESVLPFIISVMLVVVTAYTLFIIRRHHDTW